MTTWSFRPALAALALASLAACDGVPAGLSLGESAAMPLAQASMAGGTVTLVPPQGYCIDSQSLSQRFAIMARCDKLGAEAGGFGVPIGILTASFTRATSDVLPTPEITAEALGLQNVSATRASANAVFFRAEAPPTIDGTSATHWRATARIGDQVMGLALYGPAQGRATGDEGRDLLSEVIAATRQKDGA